VNRFSDIRTWAADRNLINGSSPDRQFLKLVEETGELAAALARKDFKEVYDAIGDIAVVLTILSSQLGNTVENCIEGAWDEIKDRKGRMVDGVFVKEADLPTYFLDANDNCVDDVPFPDSRCRRCGHMHAEHDFDDFDFACPRKPK
jgi:NTP pyrophosphatase (non-canonical NTP hydrolase)